MGFAVDKVSIKGMHKRCHCSPARESSTREAVGLSNWSPLTDNYFYDAIIVVVFVIKVWHVVVDVEVAVPMWNAPNRCLMPRQITV